MGRSPADLFACLSASAMLDDAHHRGFGLL
jgi:hypothetical protein